MKIFSFIFARGGSKGVPGKNIKKLSGEPLISYSIELAKNINDVQKVFVSTDDINISKISRGYGAEIIDRPIELALDTSSEWKAWKHAVEWVESNYGEFDVFLSLPTTAPLRNKSDIINCLSLLDGETDIVIGVTKASHSPWFNMVKKNKNNNLQLVLEGENKLFNRQESPEVFSVTTVAYVTTPKFIKNSQGVFDGLVKGFEIPQERAIDIDTPFDFEIAEYLMNRNKNKNA